MPTFLVLLFVAFVGVVYSCEEDQIRSGCRIQDRECLCGVGCDIRYRYKTREACVASLRGRARDPCSKNPCKHEGVCTQRVEDPGYSCHCAGTGYHGSRCELKCPNFHQASRDGLPADFPVDCIII